MFNVPIVSLQHHIYEMDRFQRLKIIPNCSREINILYELCIKTYGTFMSQFNRPTKGAICNLVQKILKKLEAIEEC